MASADPIQHELNRICHGAYVEIMCRLCVDYVMNGTVVRICEGEGSWPSSVGPEDTQHLLAPDYVRIAKLNSVSGPREARPIMHSRKKMNGTVVRICEGEGSWPSSVGPSEAQHLLAHDYVRNAKLNSVSGPLEERPIMHSSLDDLSAWNCNKSSSSVVVVNNGSMLMMY